MFIFGKVRGITFLFARNPVTDSAALVSSIAPSSCAEGHLCVCYNFSMNHLDIGPLYCETPLEVATFPIEFVNTITSLIPALFGIFAALWLWRKGRREWTLYVLAFFLFATGIGSTLWHGLRTPLMLSLDVFPGLIFFFMFSFLWPLFLKNRWWSYGTLLGLVVTLFALNTVVTLPASNGPPLTIFVTAALFAFGLTYVTYCVARRAIWWGVALVAFALLAATFRTIDLYTCDIIPFGTHFLWHTFLGTAAFCCIVMLVKIKEARASVA